MKPLAGIRVLDLSRVLAGPYCTALMADLANQNPRFKTIWESYRPYRGELFQWFRVAENSYDNFAFAEAAR